MIGALIRRRAIQAGPWQSRAVSEWALNIAEAVTGLQSYSALTTAVASSLGVFSAYSYIGGPIMTFTYLKPLLFGRNFHTVEYPNGNVHTITVRLVSQKRIKGQIAKLHGIDAAGILHMNVWIDKHFSEPLSNPAVMHYLSTSTADGSWIFWTREEWNLIPAKGLTLKSLGTDEIKLARLRAELLQQYLLKFETARKDSGLHVSADSMQLLLGLAAEQDPVLLALHASHSETNASAFRALALLRLQQQVASVDESCEGDIAAFIHFLDSLVKEYRHAEHSRQEGLRCYETGVQLAAHALSGSPAPLLLFKKYQLIPALFLRYAEQYLDRKGDFLELSAGIFQYSEGEGHSQESGNTPPQ